MGSILHSSINVVHLLAVGLALGAGTGVLLLPKGTSAHRRLGWLYAGSMVVVLGTAFGIYSLFGRFGVVHWGAVASIGLLVLGVGAALGRAVLPGWLRWHYVGMGASITGLYAALVVESTYRLSPVAWFWWSTLGPASLVFAAGAWLMRWHYPAWVAQTAGSTVPRTSPSPMRKPSFWA